LLGKNSRKYRVFVFNEKDRIIFKEHFTFNFLLYLKNKM